MSNSAFNSDPQVQQVVTYLVNKYGIEHAIETGTSKADTTVFLAGLCKSVRTVEVINSTFDQAVKKCSAFPNIKLQCGSSDDVLKSVWIPEHMVASSEAIPQDESRLMFYLDAHWHEHWPLRNELEIIGKNCQIKDRSLIIIDDFETPNRRYQYDSYGQHRCSLNYISDILSAFYNTHDQIFLGHTDRDGIGVGKLFLVPKSWESLNDWTCKEKNILFTKRFLENEPLN